MLVAILLTVDDSLGMDGFEHAVPVLGVEMRGGLRMYDFFIIGFVLECCCSGCGGPIICNILCNW